MKKCFVDVGLAPSALTHESATYLHYKDHKHGSLNLHLRHLVKSLNVAGGQSADAGGSTFTLGELIETQDGTTMFTRNDETPDDMDPESESDEEDCEGDEDDEGDDA